MKKKRAHKIAGSMVSFCFLLSLFLPSERVWAFVLENAALNAGQAQVKMEINYGLNQTTHMGGRVPISIRISAEANGNFEGMLSIRLPSQDYVMSGITYVINGLLPNGLEEPYNQVITREIPVSIKGGDVWRKTFYGSTRYSMDRYEFVLRDQMGEIVCQDELEFEPSYGNSSYVVGVVSDNEEYVQRLNGVSWPYSEIVEIEHITPVLLKPEELTVENLKSDMPDALLLADCSRKDLSMAQQGALKNWEARGGILLESVTPENAAEVLEEALINGDVNRICLRVSMGEISIDYGSYVLQDMPIREKPNIVVYGLILVIYAFAAGPGLYLILKKLHKRYRLWSSMVVLSLGFVTLIGVYSSATRIRAPFLTYVETIEQQEGSVCETVEFGMQAPFNRSHSLYVDGSYELIPWISDNGISSKRILDTSTFGQINISAKEEKQKITVSDFPAFFMTKYKLTRETDMGGEKGLTADIQVFDGKASGTVTNHTAFDMKNVVVVMPASGVWVGDLKKGETCQITERQITSQNDMEQEVYYLERSKDALDEQQKFAQEIWMSFLTMKNIYTRQDSMIMAEIADPDTSWQMDSGYETHGYSYYFAPAEVRMTQGGYLYCPYVQQYRSDENTAYIPGMARSYAYIDEEEYTATYHLNDILEELKEKRMTVEQISFSQNQYVDKYTVPFQGEIDFYNYEEDKFVNIEQNETSFQVDELTAYLNSENELTVRYRIGEEGLNETKTCILPNIQVIGKVY